MGPIDLYHDVERDHIHFFVFFFLLDSSFFVSISFYNSFPF